MPNRRDRSTACAARRRLTRLSTSLGALLLLGGVAFGQASPPKADCDCRAAGTNWSQGMETCLGGQIYVCGMNQNVSSWLETGQSCPSARRIGRPRHYAEAAFSSLSE